MASEQDGIDLLARVERQLAAIPQRGVAIDFTGVGGSIFIRYARVVRLHLATSILLMEGLPAEALVLLRSLIESSLQLMYLETVDEDGRKALILGTINDGLSKIEHLEAEYRRLEPGGSRQAEMAKFVRDQRRRLQAKQQTWAVTKLRGFPSEKQMATHLKPMDEEYLDFETANDHVHGGYFAQASSIRRVSDDTIGAFVRDHDPAKRIPFALTAAKWALRSQQAMCEIAGWESGEVEGLLKVCADFELTSMEPPAEF